MNPDELIFYSNIAAVHIEKKDYAAAIQSCDKGIEKSKGTNYDYVKLAKVMARKASALEKFGEFDTAIKCYQDALLEDNATVIKDALKKLQKDKKDADVKAYLNPEIAEEHKKKGNEFFKDGKFPDAIKEFDEGLRRDPKNVNLYTNRSFAFIKLLEPSQGMKDALKALDLDPTFVKAWARKGTCHQMMKEYHKALEAYDKGLGLDSSSKECTEGKAKTMNLIQASQHASSGNDEERMQHAMADPEIQMIMRDPTVQQVLRDMQENPAAGQAALRDPTIMAKIQKLIAAGVLKTA
jgi:stress-induced-phosphoprotein 1